MSIQYGEDPVSADVRRVLETLESGQWNDSESALVDLKEEAGRRDRSGSVLPGQRENEHAATQVASEAACMANTPGGGALILGVADDGKLIGTALDTEWLRYRVYQLTQQTLTISTVATTINGTRILVITAPQAIEPIRWRGKVNWRVDDKCVEVDPATWHTKRMIRTNYDWSAEPSNVATEQVREAAVDIARRFLRDSGEQHASELAAERTPDLLRRLNVVTGEGMLTNAGVLAFVGRGEPGLDYLRRDHAGGDSRQRVHARDRALLEELADVFTHMNAYNDVRHLPNGAAVGQVRDLPEQAIREAVVNGIAHREWAQAEATTIEHVGNTLRVTSPGGFFGGVTSANIITHPSRSRNRALAELFSAIRVAEREGIGVDRMVGEMLRVGHRAPEIEEIAGPYVRASLVGDVVDASWMQWLASMTPAARVNDLNTLLLLRQTVDTGWFDVETAMPTLQLNRAETEGAVSRLTQVTIRDRPVIRSIVGVPVDQPAAWSLGPAARAALQSRDRTVGTTRMWPSKEAIALSYAGVRGRISTTEFGSIIGASPTNVGSVLKALESAGELEPSRPNRRGPGFYFRPPSD